MSQLVLTVILVVLVANVLVAIVRVVLGPSVRDRLLGLALTSTTGAAALIVVSTMTGIAGLRDAALVVVALATVVVLARVAAERDADSRSADGEPGADHRSRRLG